MEKLRILFATMEIDPFLRITEAADFLRLLPQGIQDKGHEVRILMPKFGVINERRNRLHEVVRLSGINIRVGNEEKPLTIKVATIPNARLQVYFLDNEDYFQRKSVLVDPDNQAFYGDNDERAIFFSRGVIETVKKLGWTPNIIHCHGWMTSLIPLYLKTHFRTDPIFSQSKVVYTVYDSDAHQPLPANFGEKATMDGIPADMLKAYDGSTFAAMARGGMHLADAVTYSEEITDPNLKESLTAVGARHTGSAESSESIDIYHSIYQSIL